MTEKIMTDAMGRCTRPNVCCFNPSVGKIPRYTICKFKKRPIGRFFYCSLIRRKHPHLAAPDQPAVSIQLVYPVQGDGYPISDGTFDLWGNCGYDAGTKEKGHRCSI